VMQYKFEIKPKLEKKLKKIEKKDPVMFKAARDKIEEIIKNPRHYKPLRYDMKGLRRVHLEKSFVLMFEIDEEEKMVRFLDLDHHDEIYRKKY
jgi:YafQ family addiction module toxin component